MDKMIAKLPIVDAGEITLDRLEADLAAANKRVNQAAARRDEILDRMLPYAKARAISILAARGIELGKTRVIVSQRRYWRENEWEYKEAFVMNVTASASSRWGSAEKTVDIEYEFALVKKDGTPSKANTGIHYGATIERVAKSASKTHPHSRL